MINKITLNQVNSYKKISVLETDKKVNLIYGLNGTGKSTFSNFLLNPANPKFSNCQIEGLLEENTLHVYNQNFIQNNFFEPDNLNGIFTLSKANRDAEIKITNATKEVEAKSIVKTTKEIEIETLRKSLAQSQLNAKNKIWEIKTNYTGGDRVLEFCMEGYRSDGNKLLSFVETLAKVNDKPSKTIEQIKEDVQSLSGDNSKPINLLPIFEFNESNIEFETIFEKQITGNKNSSVSSLIDHLGNSDWVKEGFKFIKHEDHAEKNCPFCQEKTITEKLIQDLKSYFDAEYESDIQKIRDLYNKYNSAINSLPRKSDFESNPKMEFWKKDFEILTSAMFKVFDDNLTFIFEKIKSPSVAVKLKNAVSETSQVNSLITAINLEIDKHNLRVSDLSSAFSEIKSEFWNLMRWEYDAAIETYKKEKDSFDKAINLLLSDSLIISQDIQAQQQIIIEQQKLTVNIEEAIGNINNNLIELGIDDFKIEKHSDVLYKLVRDEDSSKVFHTLSEGEKMIISFLYFIEQCRGKKSAEEANKKKIIVIDDPISSLSHIYVFNIGRMIHNEFLRSENYEQVFVLTHSLYFFYELTDINPERRNEKQKLFRLRKNSSGSEILQMKYEEIQNDYQSYWSVIKDEQQHPALIANCMRNIIEYFYNFVEKKDFNNVFQKKELLPNRFAAFNRFMNRESHSLGQNIFDYKEFNYQDFKDAFELVFKETGYNDHYKKMISN